MWGASGPAGSAARRPSARSTSWASTGRAVQLNLTPEIEGFSLLPHNSCCISAVLLLRFIFVLTKRGTGTVEIVLYLIEEHFIQSCSKSCAAFLSHSTFSNARFSINHIHIIETYLPIIGLECVLHRPPSLYPPHHR